MSSIRVIRPGAFTTIQDLGRWGRQRFGVSVAGAMDVPAHRRANALAGNPADAASLEVTLIGPELEFGHAAVAAVAGAPFDLMLDGVPVPCETTFEAPVGGRLSFGRRRHGIRAYLAVQGGIEVPSVLGSRATHVASRCGGLEGRALRAGDVLGVGTAKAGPRVTGGPAEVLKEPGVAVVRLLAGPDLHFFEDSALEALQGAPYIVSRDANRMGYRLTGPHLQTRLDRPYISDVTPCGTVQVPPSGQPILLMADRQTIGGYPRIGFVISADLPVAAQCGPGDSLAFVVCRREDAIAALEAHERQLLALERGRS